MELYILKSSACLLILFSFYKLFLEKEDMHTFKRFYLLGAVVVAFIIPFITFTSYVVISESLTNNFIVQNSGIITSETVAGTNYLPIILWTMYGIGVFIFSFRFFRNMNHLISKIKTNPKHKVNYITNVLLSNDVIPHTFFSYIFLNKQRFEANEIPSEVLMHEQTHALQKHSFDIILLELIQIAFWFNPLVYLLKHAVKLNHEFLADQAVLNNGVAPTNYQNLLLAFSSSATPELANSINYSSTKKRFTVMKTETSRRSVLLRSLVLLPLVTILIFGFSTKEIIQKENPTAILETNPEKASSEEIQTYNNMAAFWNARFAQTNSKRIIPMSELKKLEAIYKKMTSKQKAVAETFPECSPQEQATPEQIAAYNKLAKKYNSMPQENMFVKKKDVERLKYIYNLMTPKQRKTSEPFPNFPAPPPLKAPKPIKVTKGINDLNPNAPPPPPKAPKPPKTTDATNNWVYENEKNATPPRPPTPEEPLDHIIRMAKENAAFLYEGKRISSDEAITLLKKNSNLNIETMKFDNSNPIVKISKHGIKIEK